MLNYVYHSYHLVDESPWPIICSIFSLGSFLGLLFFFHFKFYIFFILNLLLLLISSFQWWLNIALEGSMMGLHTKLVELGLQFSMILFIISEIMFFFSFFWAFFHSSLSPNIEIGEMWPPTGIFSLNPLSVPLLNTIILLSSGISLTWSHYTLMMKNHLFSISSLKITCFLGLYFTLLQLMEYKEAPFNISDSVYGSTFYIATGFHGIHVMIGTMFLLIILMRMIKGEMSYNHHLGFLAAAWYWHFVDVVWLFLFIMIYFWGN